MHFTVGGQSIDLDHDTLAARLRGKTPKPHGHDRYFINVGRKAWPVKDALATASGLDPVTFPTSEAVRVLTRLGYPVTRIEPTTRKDKE